MGLAIARLMLCMCSIRHKQAYTYVSVVITQNPHHSQRHISGDNLELRIKSLQYVQLLPMFCFGQMGTCSV